MSLKIKVASKLYEGDRLVVVWRRVFLLKSCYGHLGSDIHNVNVWMAWIVPIRVNISTLCAAYNVFGTPTWSQSILRIDLFLTIYRYFLWKMNTGLLPLGHQLSLRLR